MDFGDQVVGVAANVVLAPTDAGAAVFNASAMTPGRTVVCSILTPPVTISNGGSGTANRMTVNTFTISGCTSVVPPTGIINNIGVGATASIASNDKAGVYNNTNYGQTVRFRLITY